MSGLFIKQQPFKIIHIDMDCFYAQVEMRDNPKLRDVPLAVGGPSRTKGVVCACNYKAREYGVHSGLSTYQAVKRCPKLVLVPTNFEKYRAVSKELIQIYLAYAPKMQPISLDEAYLDVTHSTLYDGKATHIAKAIKNDIFKQTNLTASAGVSFNKMLAKIASDWNKPNGIFVITPAMRKTFMPTLSLKKIPGIGKVTFAKLEKMGFTTCQDITTQSLSLLVRIFGRRSAIELYTACLGISNNLVIPQGQKKSFSLENTYYNPVTTIKELKERIKILVQAFNERLQKLDPFHLKGREISHIAIKVRFANFESVTRVMSLTHVEALRVMSNQYIDSTLDFKTVTLITELFEQSHQPIRLLGVGVKFKDKNTEQLCFTWPPYTEKNPAIS